MTCCTRSAENGKKRCSRCSRWITKPTPRKRPLWERFDEKVTRSTNGCWVWRGGLDKDGYGIFWVSETERARRVHRLSYERHRGRIPDGMMLDHLCRNPHCVNPGHLEPVTCAENLARSPLTLNSKNRKKTHCHRGHLFDETNTGLQGDGRFCRVCTRERRRVRRRLELGWPMERAPCR